MAGYIGSKAVSVNTTSATISDDLTVGDDATIAGTLGVTGVLTATSLDISGDIDVDGTTNLDIVDIDGAVNMATTALVTGVLTTTAATVFNGGFASNADSTLGGSLTANGPRVLIQRANDDSSIAFANNASGTPSSHVWAAGLDYSNSNAFSIAYGSGGIPSLEDAKMVIATDGSASFSGNVSFPDGAAGLPSVSNNGDTNTGMYFPAADRLAFSTAGVERVVLNSAHMGLETDGVYIQLAGSSNNFWAIGSTGGNNAPGTASTTLGFHHYNGSAWNNEVEFDASGNITLDGNLKVSAGNGIDFSATSDGSGTDTSELLDDYEEGTWTAVLTATTSAPSTEVSTTGRYVKIGQVVHVFMRFTNKNTSGASGDMQISGLPYASSDVTEENAAVPMMHSLTVSEKYVTGYISGNRTIIDFINIRNNASWTSTQINATTGVYLNMNLTYRVP